MTSDGDRPSGGASRMYNSGRYDMGSCYSPRRHLLWCWLHLSWVLTSPCAHLKRRALPLSHGSRRGMQSVGGLGFVRMQVARSPVGFSYIVYSISATPGPFFFARVPQSQRSSHHDTTHTHTHEGSPHVHVCCFKMTHSSPKHHVSIQSLRGAFVLRGKQVSTIKKIIGPPGKRVAARIGTRWKLSPVPRLASANGHFQIN